MSQSAMFFIMGIAFCGIGGLSTCFALPEVWHKKNYARAARLVFSARRDRLSCRVHQRMAFAKTLWQLFF